MTGEEQEFAALIETLSISFDEMCQERHSKGQKEYGTFTFLGNDVMEMFVEELADAANYLRYQYIKLRLIQLALDEDPRMKQIEEVTIGPGSFQSVRSGHSFQGASGTTDG